MYFFKKVVRFIANNISDTSYICPRFNSIRKKGRDNAKSVCLAYNITHPTDGLSKSIFKLDIRKSRVKNDESSKLLATEVDGYLFHFQTKI